MKQLTTLLAVFFALNATAQITINQSDFPRPASFTDTTSSSNLPGIAMPTEGAEQVWDYSGITQTGVSIRTYSDATANTDFPGSLNSFEVGLGFQVFTIPSVSYDGVDANGWYNVGRAITGIGFPIGAITSGANDSLKFIGENVTYGGRLDVVQFPMTYQSSWTGAQTEITNFELTVASASLNNTPGSQNRIKSNTREVVGYGKLIIPNAAGAPSDSMDALLLKVYQSIVDSFYIGGSPAPQQLLTTFGLTQGNEVLDTFYVFYTAGFGAPVMNINFEGNDVTSAFYRTAAAGPVSSVSEVADLQVSCYPNPAQAGSTLVIAANPGKTIATQVSIIDLQGKQVSNVTLSAPQGNQYSLMLPNHLSTGIFMLQLQDDKGNTVGLTKLLVE